MCGISLHSYELTGDFGKEPEAISIGDHGLSRFLAENCQLVILDFCNTICQEPTSRMLPRTLATM
jgi:hypothetical protein